MVTVSVPPEKEEVGWVVGPPPEFLAAPSYTFQAFVYNSALTACPVVLESARVYRCGWVTEGELSLCTMRGRGGGVVIHSEVRLNGGVATLESLIFL